MSREGQEMQEYKEYTTQLGQRLQQERMLRGWSLSHLSRTSGINRRTLRDAEAGRVGTLRTLVRVAWALTMPPSDLLGGIDRARATGSLPPDADPLDFNAPDTIRKVTRCSFELRFDGCDELAGPYHCGAGDVPVLGDVLGTPDGRVHRVARRALKIEHVNPQRKGVIFQPMTLRFALWMHEVATEPIVS